MAGTLPSVFTPGDDASIARPETSREWRLGWKIVLLALFGVAFANLPLFSLGVLMHPIKDDTGWSLSEISTGLLIQAVASSIAVPFAGRFVDRYDVRRVVVPGMLAYGLALVSLGIPGSSFIAYLASWTAISLTQPFAGVLVWSAAVARAFDRQRGLAIGIAMCGTGFASAVTPLITSQLILHFDWRQTYIAMGASVLCVLPFIILGLSGQRRGPTDLSMVTPGRPAATIPIARLLRSRHFYALGYAGLILTMAATTLSIHFVSLLVSNGMTAQTAAAITGLIGVSSISGRIVTGLLLDRTRGPILGGMAFTLPMITAALLFVGGGSEWLAALAAITLGLAIGAEVDVLAFMTARYFGTRSFGGVYGLLMVSLVVGTGAGPWLTSRWIDFSGSYTLVLICVMPISVLAAVGLATLGPWRQVIPEAA